MVPVTTRLRLGGIGGSTMVKFMATLLTTALLLGSALSLAACNTTAGAGKDISAAGQGITDTAKKATQ